ncbi:NlpC/P60 family protein [Methylobacillus sp.]|uniref:NlpC/P60 family protein n=1 Tax=Methylobacillus sp. TaxID=56818 RepID=UPI0012CE774C|nr:NlpC/P60 family protein [Methylobacillus sp.]MPS48554.1 hypothetical protein [Methylobacillus sp.]
MHWAGQYVGTPWVKGGQGPNGYDCWGFVRFVQQKHFDRALSHIDADADSYREVITAIEQTEERHSWVQVQKPAEGDCVLMAHAKYPSHVGVWLDVDGGGVLHCVRGEGVVFSSMSALKLAGWGKVEFYQYVGNT